MTFDNDNDTVYFAFALPLTYSDTVNMLHNKENELKGATIS